MAKKKSIDYRDRLKAIRPFVAFNYDLRQKLTPAQKAKITRYYNALEPILSTSADIHVYRPRSNEGKKAAAKIMPTFSGMKELRAFPIPKPRGQKTRVKVRNGKPIIETAHVKSEFIPLNQHRLAEDPKAEVSAAISGKPYKRYSLAAGETFEVKVTFSPDILPEKIAEYMARYDIDPESPDRVANPRNAKNWSANHHWKNWLFGIYGYSFDNQADLNEYRMARRKQKKQRRKRRK